MKTWIPLKVRLFLTKVTTAVWFVIIQIDVWLSKYNSHLVPIDLHKWQTLGHPPVSRQRAKDPWQSIRNFQLTCSTCWYDSCAVSKSTLHVTSHLSRVRTWHRHPRRTDAVGWARPHIWSLTDKAPGWKVRAEIAQEIWLLKELEVYGFHTLK